MEIDNPGSKTVTRPSFNSNADNTYSVPSNTIYDFRNRVALQHEPSTAGFNPYRFNSMAASSVACGGKSHVTNAAYLNMTWAEAHGNDAVGGNIPASRTETCVAGSKMQGFYFHGAMDGIVPDTDAHDITYENICIINCKDDCIQNDNQCKFTLNNAYLQGHVFISERPGGSTIGVKGKLLRMNHCLVHMARQPNDGDEKAHAGQPGADYGHAASRRAGPYNGPTQRNNGLVAASAGRWFAHKWFFKTDAIDPGSTTLMSLDIRNCLFRIDTMPVEGPERCIFPTDGNYENLTVLWLGPTNTGTDPGPWPFPQSKSTLASMGITVIDDEAIAWAMWNEVSAAWHVANGYDAATDTFAWNRL
jgi:hypothetical protein